MDTTNTAERTADLVGIPGHFWKYVVNGRTIMRADALKDTVAWRVTDCANGWTTRMVADEETAAMIVGTCAVLSEIGH